MRTIFIFLLLISLGTRAQRHRILTPRIATLQVVAGIDWLSPPVIRLNDNVPINISFDDLTHEYHRYAYKVEHCNADWSLSKELFTSDYIDGFDNDHLIEDIQESINTDVLYTHYRFQIPNSSCRLKMSGNYRVTIYDANNEDQPVAECFFMVVEPLMGVTLNVISNTDRDINGRHQQVEMKVNYGGIKIFDVNSQIHTAVLQNGRWDNAVLNPQPQYTTTDGLQWLHNRDLIFTAGNEYRKFELLSLNHTSMGVERIHWDGTMYQAYLWPDEPRRSYVYDEDANGAFYIRNSDNIENNHTSHYLNVHFTLKAPRQNGEVYLNGAWTNDLFEPPYRMVYDDIHQCYKASLLLKQGYYSYQYVLQQPDGSSTYVSSEGSFFPTENRYQALIYFRKQGERADRLVGYQQVRYP